MTTTTNNWKEEFDKYFTETQYDHWGKHDRREIKSFITTHVIPQERKDEAKKFMEEMQKRASMTPPNLLLNEIVNYAHDRIKELK